jgi:hypothetical protein
MSLDDFWPAPIAGMRWRVFRTILHAENGIEPDFVMGFTSCSKKFAFA